MTPSERLEHALATAADRIERTTDEVASAITHGIGLALAVIGGAVLLVAAVLEGSPRVVAACAVFATSLVLLYAASTGYHAACGTRRKARLRLLDHLAILYLIAGTYTPFALVSMGRPWGYVLLALAWGIALGGTAYKLVSTNRYANGATWIYLGMGWMAVLFAKPMWDALPAGALGWLAAGGLLYTGGVFFYLRERWRFDHAAWHLFVLGGSVCHYLAVLLYVV